jgi:hypothetical protein
VRNLSDQEEKELARRKAGFDAFLQERMPVLVDFMQALELQNAADVLQDAEKFVSPLDVYLKDQTITDDDRIWILTRLGYFIGELLVQKLNGCWLLNENPDSRTFMRYVVGQFSKIKNTQAMIDPFFVADTYLSEAPGRSLVAILEELLSELMNA